MLNTSAIHKAAIPAYPVKKKFNKWYFIIGLYCCLNKLNYTIAVSKQLIKHCISIQRCVSAALIPITLLNL